MDPEKKKEGTNLKRKVLQSGCEGQEEFHPIAATDIPHRLGATSFRISTLAFPCLVEKFRKRLQYKSLLPLPILRKFKIYVFFIRAINLRH